MEEALISIRIPEKDLKTWKAFTKKAKYNEQKIWDILKPQITKYKLKR